MNPLIVLTIMALVFAGVYLLLSLRFWEVIIGTVFLSHAVNLLLLSSGGYASDAHPPIIRGSGPYMDPLPQALILTAIVISFGVTAFILVVFRQVYQSTSHTDLGRIEQDQWQEESHD